MATLNEVIHQPARLRIMAVLAAISPERQVTFGFLKSACDLTDGNLGAHLRRLEEAGYITIVKAFVRQKPQTYVQITEAGRAAFEEHRAALQAILESG
jgi:DNA-binding MarR family transcriptional regulator